MFEIHYESIVFLYHIVQVFLKSLFELATELTLS